jgi:hypothetical protein
MSDPMGEAAFSCQLDPPDREVRRQEFQALQDRALIARDSIEGGVRLRLRVLPGVEAAVRGLIERERECCPFLDLTLDRRPGELWFEVRGPADASSAVPVLLRPPD